MNSVDYDRKLCDTVPISEYNAEEKVRTFQSVSDSEYFNDVTLDRNASNPVEQFLAHVRRERLRSLAEEIADNLLGFPKGGGDFPDPDF